MKILVTGANGMLGQDLCPILEDEGHEVIETDVNDLDITDKNMVEKVLKEHKPEVVIHCAAYTNVDKAESEPEIAQKIKRTEEYLGVAVLPFSIKNSYYNEGILKHIEAIVAK